MTPWELIVALVRRWPIVIAGALVTATFGLLAISADGVYWSRTEVVFLAPSSAAYPNSLQTTSEDIIITAGAVVKRVVGPERVLKLGSIEPTIIGIAGQHDGYWVRLPDSGGQWAPNFSTQVVFVDVVAQTPERVKEVQSMLTERLASELAALQHELHVPDAAAMRTTVAPESSTIHYVRGSRPRALAMTAALGISATIAAVALLEYLWPATKKMPTVRRPQLSKRAYRT